MNNIYNYTPLCFKTKLISFFIEIEELRKSNTKENNEDILSYLDTIYIYIYILCQKGEEYFNILKEKDLSDLIIKNINEIGYFLKLNEISCQHHSGVTLEMLKIRSFVQFLLDYGPIEISPNLMEFLKDYDNLIEVYNDEGSIGFHYHPREFE